MAVKFSTIKEKKQKKIAKMPTELKGNYDLITKTFHNHDSRTIRNSINDTDGSHRMNHAKKLLEAMAKRREKIEDMDLAYPFFRDVVNNLTVTPNGLLWKNKKTEYKAICRIIEEENDLLRTEGSKILWAAVDAHNLNFFNTKK